MNLFLTPFRWSSTFEDGFGREEQGPAVGQFWIRGSLVKGDLGIADRFVSWSKFIKEVGSIVWLKS